MLDFIALVCDLALIALFGVFTIAHAEAGNRFLFSFTYAVAVWIATRVWRTFDRGHRVNDPLPRHWSEP